MAPLSSTCSSTPAAPCGNLTLHARAYCGPAHGQVWSFCSAELLPEQVRVSAGPTTACYQLVRHPQTGRPAHDRHSPSSSIRLIEMTPSTVAKMFDA